MITRNEYTRRFSLEDDFMDYSTNDLLYGFMQYLATYHPVERKLYLTKQKFQENKKIISAICGYKSNTTIRNNVAKLLLNNFISEELVKLHDTDIECYTFPYDCNCRYQLINNEMLWYIISTRNLQAIKVYLYLLNKYNWKVQENKNYEFSISEIKLKLGYSSATKTADSLIGNILESFAREGIISYEDIYEARINEHGNTIPMPKKILKFVAVNKNELRKF